MILKIWHQWVFNVHNATRTTLTTWRPQQEWAEFVMRCVARSKDHERIGTSNASLSTISSTFNSLFKVLCIFPSRYLCAIGLSPVFSFRWNLPPGFGLHSQTTRLIDQPTTTVSQNINHLSHERDCHPPWCHFPMDFDSVGSVWMVQDRKTTIRKPICLFAHTNPLTSWRTLKRLQILNLSCSQFTRRYWGNPR